MPKEHLWKSIAFQLRFPLRSQYLTWTPCSSSVLVMTSSMAGTVLGSLHVAHSVTHACNYLQ